MHKIWIYRSYSKEHPIDTKFDICIKSVKNMKFNSEIFKICIKATKTCKFFCMQILLGREGGRSQSYGLCELTMY